MPTSEYLDKKIETAGLREIRPLQETKLTFQFDYLILA
jgi:hypothetical protein